MKRMKKRKFFPGVSRALDDFLLKTNLSFGGPLNNETYEALYEFIKYTHANSVRLSDDVFRDFLLEQGAQISDADKIASIYLHCRNLLYRKRRRWTLLIGQPDG
jgi:hypothetical protein